jgi:hypothetical protein
MSMKITPMSELVSASRTAILKSTKAALEAGRRSYIEVGKSCIALKSMLRDNETLYGVLKKAHVKPSQIANGQQIAKVWESWVASDKMTEAFFDKTMNYALAVSLNRLTREDPEKAEAYLKEPEEWESLSQHGMTCAAWEKAEADKAAAAAETARKLETARVDEAARKLNEASTSTVDETEADETPAEPETDETPAEPDEIVEVDAPTPLAQTDNVSNANIPKTKIPALREALEHMQLIVVEIARDGPHEAIEAGDLLSQYLVSAGQVIDAIETEEVA